MTLSLQMCHLATKAEAIDSFGKVGGREARLNANFSTFATSRAHARVGTHDKTREYTREEKRLFYFARVYSHEPRTTILKQARVNAREKVSS